ncbi:hypothetical protein [Streptomyces youssoufiensis]
MLVENDGLPERLPEGGAATAAATSAARAGELRAARGGERTAVGLRQEPAARVSSRVPAGQGPREPGERGPEEADEHLPEQAGEQRASGGLEAPGRGAGEPGATEGTDGAGVGFVELDLEPLLPPLWGQSPARHEAEVRDCRQALARDAGVAKEKVAAFVEGRRARSAELAVLAPRLAQQVGGAKAGALAGIGAAEKSGMASVRAAVSGARSSVRAQAASARAQVEAGHAGAVAAMSAAADAARTGMESGARTAHQSVAAKQNQQKSALGELYAQTEQRIRESAQHAGSLAVSEGKKRAEQYRAGMIHRDDNWWDGPLTDNRCKAQAKAAEAVGEAYRDELPKAADEPIAEMRKGKPDAEKTIGKVADDVRESLEKVLQQSRQGLADAHTQSTDGAGQAKTAALAGISQALSSAEASLAQLQSAQIAAIRTQATQQRRAVTRSAASAITEIESGVATARAGLERGLSAFVRILAKDAVPDPRQLDETLRETGAGFDERVESLTQRLGAQAGQAGQALGAMGERTAQGVEATARTAAQSARQTAAATGQTLSRTATQTVSGLRQVQQGFAEIAKTLHKGHGDANQQVLEGLDKAYTELAGKFKKGADDQAKGIADALSKAATGSGKGEINPAITKEAKKARDKVKPRWHAVLTIVVVIVVVIALTIVLGPLVIGGISALAGGSAAAGVIGTVVGGAIVGAVAGAVGAVVSNVLNGAPVLDGVVKAAVFGAIGGAVGGGVSTAVAKTSLSTGARVAVEMVVEVAVEVSLEAVDAARSGRDYSWGDALLTAATTVAVTGVMAHPRIQALTLRVQTGIEGKLGQLGLKIPGISDTTAPDTSATPDTPGASGIDRPNASATDAPLTQSPSTPGTSPDGAGPGTTLDGTSGTGSRATPDGSPQPGRGPDGATSWDGSTLDPTGGAGSADGPVRPRDLEGMQAELRTALGSLADRVDVTIDPDLPGRTVRVHYDLGDDGLITNVRMTAGASVTPNDIRLHTRTARTMLRYSGLSGRVRNLLRQVNEWIGIHGAPPVGSRAWEAHLEVRKLRAIIADRAGAYAGADPAMRAELESEIDSLYRQYEAHATTLREWNVDAGRGYVAAEETGKEVAARIEENFPGRLPKVKEGDSRRWAVGVGNDGSIVRLELWEGAGTGGKKVGEYHPVTGHALPSADKKKEEIFDPDTTPEQAFEILGGRDPGKELGKFIEAFKSLNMKPREGFPDALFGEMPDAFIALMSAPGGRPHNKVRSPAKAPLRRAVVEHITDPRVIEANPRYAELIADGHAPELARRMVSHEELLRLSGMMASADRGSLGEAWYLRMHASDNAQTQVSITKSAAKKEGIELKEDRKIDFLDGNKAIEVKNVSKELDRRAKTQLEDLHKMIGRSFDGKDGSSTVAIKEAIISFPDPAGVLANSAWLRSFLRDADAPNMQIELFNSRGEVVLVHHDGKELVQKPPLKGGGTIFNSDDVFRNWSDL